MIRINLLALEPGKAKKRQATRSEAGQKIAVASTLVLVLAGVGVAWWYRSIQKEATRLTADIALAEREAARLRTIIAQVRDFEQRKAQLQERVVLIEQLRKGQSGPVHLLDEISRSLPDMVWLTELTQKDAEITLQGRGSSLTGVSDFVTGLERTGWFAKPVEITDTQEERGSGSTSNQATVFKFTIKARIAQPGL